MLAFKLVLKNLFRHKLRTLLTVLGITIALLAFGLLRTVLTTWYGIVESASASRLVTRNAVSLIFPLPLAYKDRIRQVEGVSGVSFGSWFGGVYIDEKHFFANYAVEPRTYLDLFPEVIINPGEKEVFLKDRKGAVAGRKLIEKYGWKTGDIVVLKGTIFPGEWEFVLRAVYRGRDKTVDESAFFFHWDYLNETLRKTMPGSADQVGFYMIGLKSPDLAGRVSETVDSMFRNSVAETLTETEKAFHLAFLSMSEAILIVIRIVSVIVILIILVVVANTMAMSSRERLAEYAVFKTLGFTGWHLAGLVFGEAILITSAGCAVAGALTIPAAELFATALSDYFPVFYVERETLLMDAAASLLVGFFSALIPAWRIARIRVADALRMNG